jgi:glyoxylase-like metal-dependent hydrolase (beta-lactamase superfamily II)
VVRPVREGGAADADDASTLKREAAMKWIGSSAIWRAAVALALAGASVPASLAAQAAPFSDSLLDQVRALARSVPGERPRAVHVIKLAESTGALSNYVAGADSQRVPSCFAVFQIRYSDRWIVVDAGLDREAIAQFYGANNRLTFWPDRYDRIQAALRDAEHVVLTHEHLDHAVGVTRGPYFRQVAAKTLLTAEQLQAFLSPPSRGIVRLAADTAAFFPTLRYDRLFPLAPGVVLIKAPGHTPGSQFVYVRLESGREILLAGDVAWQTEGLATGRQKPDATARALGEDREAVQAQLDWVRRVFEGGTVAVVLSHDSRSLDALVARGVLVSDLDLTLP